MEQFSLTLMWDSNRSYHSESEGLMSNVYEEKLYIPPKIRKWSLITSVISRILVGRVLPHLQRWCRCIIQLQSIAPTNRLIGLVGRLLANGPGDLGSIPSRVIPKTLKMVLDTPLLNTQQYKVRIKGKVEQSTERSSTLLYTSVK